MATPGRNSTVTDALRRLDRLGVGRQRLTVDSRSITPGDVFIAVPGARADGREFIASALASGAVAVLREASDRLHHDTDVRVIDVDDLSACLGDIAAAFYGHPSLAMRVIGITGTNGKTSIANWLSQALSALGIPCAAVGTLGVSLGAKQWSTNNTTPDAAHLQTILRDLQAAGAQAAALEISSHALTLNRAVGTTFETVVFTNLTQDHLDFHGTMAAYGAAKSKLFTDFSVKNRVINADDEFGAALIARKLPDTLTYGLREGDVRGEVTAMSAAGMRLAITFGRHSIEFETPAIGRFNAYNLVAVAATLIASGVPLNLIATTLPVLKAAPGRMQRVNAGNDGDQPSVYVDYAHTPDALAKALETVRETCPRALAVVFGCGGDRDRSKRPLMGKIAADRADQVYVTSDNPRSELPAAIIDDIVSGVSGDRQGSLNRVVLRRDAIQLAIKRANARDAILIAGKGHETYQEVAGIRYPFSDVDEALIALSTRNASIPPHTEDRHVGQ